MAAVSPARRAAYEVLLRVFEREAYADRAFRSAARTGGSSFRTGRRPSFSIAWSSVRTRCTEPYASRCANARSRSSSPSAALRKARSA